MHSTMLAPLALLAIRSSSASTRLWSRGSSCACDTHSRRTSEAALATPALPTGSLLPSPDGLRAESAFSI